MADQKEKLSFSEQMRSTFFALEVVFKQAKLYSVSTLVYSLYSGLAPVAQGYFAGMIFAELARLSSGMASRSRLLTFVVLSAIVSALNFAASNFSNALFGQQRESLAAKLNGELLEKYASLRLEMLEMPDVKERFEKAGSGMREVIWVVSSVSGLVSALVSIIGSLILITKTSPWLAVVFLPLPFITVSMRVKVQRLRRDSWKTTRVERMRLSSVEDMFTRTTGVIELRLYGLARKFVALWHRNQKTVLEATHRGDLASTRSSILIELLESLIGVCVDIWLVVRVFAGAFSIGIFEQTRRLVGTYVGALSTVSSSLGNIAADTLALNDYRVFVQSKLDESLFRSSKVLKQLTTAPETFELRDVTFRYPGSKSAALKHLNLDLNTAQHVALVGENGSGKTTLLKVLLGLYDPVDGAVLIGGHDTRELDSEALAPYVSPLMQDFSEFNFMSIKESVAVSENGQIDEDRVRDVLKLVGLYDYIVKQPKGLESTLGWAYDDSLRLSGGQWQRLAIARALYKDASILILDEPTSAIDAKSEQDIIDAIFERYRGKMVIVVSHRISTVKRAERILVLKEGKIVEDGTHKALFVPGTAYFDLFGKQALAMKENPSE